jgi:transcriptional regulator with XRE-family HTH domain
VARHLANTLKSLIKERDLSISPLNKRTGISRGTLYRILRAESLPTSDELLRLAEKLGVLPASLIEPSVKERKRSASGSNELDEVRDLQHPSISVSSKLRLL